MLHLPGAMGTWAQVYQEQGPLYRGIFYSELEDGAEPEDDVGAGELRTIGGNGGGGAPPPPDGDFFIPTGGVIASLRGVPNYLTLRIRGMVQGQCVAILVDSGATHNFIDAQMLQWRGTSLI